MGLCQTVSFQVLNPECAAVTLQVFDEDLVGVAKDFLAFASLTASALRPGLRTVPLLGPQGREGAYSYASLLVRITMEHLTL